MNGKKRLCVKLLHCGNLNISNPQDNAQKNIFYMPMGLFPMAARLKDEGFDIEIIHLDLEHGRPIEEILDLNTVDAVGFDCHWINQAMAVMETAALVKKSKPGMYIFLGGFSASLFAEEILRDHPQVDAVIRGDGEHPIVELCKRLEDRETGSWESVPNLVWRDPQGQVKINEFSYVAAAGDMEQLDFSRIDLLRNWQNYRDLCEFWTRYQSINSLPLFLLSIGRGCVYTCSFCGGNAKAQYLINHRRGQIVRSVESVILTIKKAVSFGFTLFYTCFDFQDCEAWYISLFNRIKEENLKISYGLGCYSIPSKVLIDTISESFEEVIFELSPESGDIHLRNRNKDTRISYTNQQLEECLEYIGTKPNINIQLYFSYFLPYETEETIYTTMKYISGLNQRYSHFTELIYGNLSTDPGSMLYFEPGAYEVNIKVKSFNDYLERLKETYLRRKDRSAPDMTLFRPSSMSEPQFIRLAGKIRYFDHLLKYFGPSMQLLFKRAGDTGIAVDYLKQMQVTPDPGEELTVDKLKRLFLDICEEHIMLDPEIIETVNRDYQMAPSLDIRLKARL